MLGAIGRGEHRGHRECGRDGGYPYLAGEAALQCVDLLMHSAGVTDDPPRPFEHPLAFRREAAEPRAAVDEQHAEAVLKLLDAGRQRRLAHAAGLGGAAEMPLPRQRDDEFQLVEHPPSPRRAKS